MLTRTQRRGRLALRRRIRVHRRFDVELLEDGLERQTCRTCGAVEDRDPHRAAGRSPNLVLLRKLTAYRASSGGVYGVCGACSKLERDRRWPLK